MIRHSLRDWLLRWREPIIYGGGAALLVIWLAESGLIFSWVGLAILGLVGFVALGFIRAAFRDAYAAGDGEGPGVVTVNERQIAYYGPTTGGFIELDALAEVRIVTTDDGPFEADVLWLLIPLDGPPLHIPNDALGAEALLPALQALPGFDNAAVVRAMGSTTPATFTIWRADAAAASAMLASDPDAP